VATQRSALMLGLIPAWVLLSGCVMPDQMSQLQKDIADVRHQLHELQREQGEALEKLAAMEVAPDPEEQDLATREDMAELIFRVDQVARDTAIAGAQLNEMTRRFDRLTDELGRTQELVRGRDRGPSPGAGTDGGTFPPSGRRTSTTTTDPDGLYNTAYADFSKGNYELAISGFEEYLQQFPGTTKADNALYWVGECNFSQGNFAEALRSFDRLLEQYPGSDRAASGNLKKALTFLEQNQVDQAIVQLQYVVSTYAGTDEARVARDKLTSLGVSI